MALSLATRPFASSACTARVSRASRVSRSVMCVKAQQTSKTTKISKDLGKSAATRLPSSGNLGLYAAPASRVTESASISISVLHDSSDLAEVHTWPRAWTGHLTFPCLALPPPETALLSAALTAAVPLAAHADEPVAAAAAAVSEGAGGFGAGETALLVTPVVVRGEREGGTGPVGGVSCWVRLLRHIMHRAPQAYIDTTPLRCNCGYPLPFFSR